MLGFPKRHALLISTALATAVLSCTSFQKDQKSHQNEALDLPGIGPVISSLSTDVQYSIYGMVATGTAESTRIGVEVLESGGNAVDAAVAAAFALGVADPGDSGLGGATYILIRFADGRATAIDGSAVMPLRADRAVLSELDESGAESGIARAAVPASLMALEYAALKYGTRTLAALIEPSIQLAEHGYRANDFQEVSIRSYFDDVLESDFLKYFILDEGSTPPTTESIQCRPVLANTLRRIAAGGAHEFYRGSIAAEIEADMTARGGFVSRSDLGIFNIREVAPNRSSYRGVEVLTMPYPSSGGAVIEALNILEQFPADDLAENSAVRHHRFVEAFHMAVFDHAKLWTTQSAVVRQMLDLMQSKEFAAERAALIKPGQAIVSEEFPRVADKSAGDGNTTQVSVVDRWGNAVSLTQSLGRFFGSKRLSPDLGFPYNSLLEGMRDIPTRGPIPNFMCPTIVTREEEVFLVLGSSSSDRIPGVVATIISNMVDRGFDLREAVLAPRVLWGMSDDPGPYAEIFPPITPQQIDELESFGYQSVFRAELPVRQSGLARFGSVNAVHLDRHTRILTGIGDPRRNGSALGAEY